ncbi:MAG: hypothetical protein HKN20_16705 [Gemmatimonadetes bacterium]|nr:hypothetical protein [Gemmatimonadota bacterium]
MRVARFIIPVLLAVLLAAAHPPVAEAQTPRDELANATNEFNYGNFLNALSIVNRLTTGGALSGDDLRDAYALQARCEAELGNRVNARNAFCEVIQIDGSWRPDSSLYTSTEKEIFEEALLECRQEGGGRNKWYLIGGGAAAAVLLAILAGGSGGGGDGDGDGNGDGNGTLPGFPDPPTN